MKAKESKKIIKRLIRGDKDTADALRRVLKFVVPSDQGKPLKAIMSELKEVVP